MIREAVALADKIRNGIDINGDENIEPIPGEGGAVTAYEHAYYMADMVIVPSASQSPHPRLVSDSRQSKSKIAEVR